MKALVIFALAVVSTAPAFGQCYDVAGAHAQGTFTGVLESHVFPGPPSWTDLAKGDQPREIFILRLPRKICIEDGGQFADPKEMFDGVHLSSYDASPPWAWLNAHVGQRVTLTGAIFASENAAHLAPLVMMLPQGWSPPQ